MSWGWRRRSTLVEGSKIYGNEDEIVGVQVSKGNEVAEVMFQDKEREKMKSDISVTSVEDVASEDIKKEVSVEEKSQTKEEHVNDITSARTKYPRKSKVETNYLPIKIASKMDRNSRDVKGDGSIVISQFQILLGKNHLFVKNNEYFLKKIKILKIFKS